MELAIIALALGFVVWRLNSRTARRSTAECGPVGWTDGAKWAVARPLGRAESRRFVRHPVFLIGVALTPLMMFGAAGNEQEWRVLSSGIALACVPLGWFTIIATNRLALRHRRNGTDELWATLPAPQPVRTAALLSTIAAATAAAAVLAIAFVVLLALGGEDLIGSPRWTDVAAGSLIVAGSVTVGVAVARWLPHPVAGVTAVFASTIIQARFLDVATWPWNQPEASDFRFLGFLASGTNVKHAALELRPAGWHLVYLVALVAFMAVAALARDGVPRVVGAGLVLTVGVASLAGWVQTRPPSEAEVAAMVSFLTDRAAHQDCHTEATVEYCVYRAESEREKEWHVPVNAVLALLPPEVAARPLAVHDRVPTVAGDSSCEPQPFVDALPVEVVARLSPDTVWPPDDAVHPGTDRLPCGGARVSGFFLAVQASLWAVDLPPSPHHDDVRCRVDGQARGVLALWLAGRATPNGAQILRDVIAEGADGGDLGFSGWNDPPMWGVRFTVGDAQEAIQLLEQDSAALQARLARDWDVLTDPRTPSSELFSSAGAATPLRIATRGDTFCP